MSTRWSFGLAALAAVGCATAPAASSGDAGATPSPSVSTQAASDSVIMVTVTHNRADGGIMTIYIEPAAGVRQSLGTIDPGSTKTFIYRVESQNRQVRLSALTSLGQTMQSNQITVPRGAGVAWDLGINSVRVRR